MNAKHPSRLDAVMSLLGLSALELSRHCGVSNSLISRLQKGQRPLTPRSSAVTELAATLARLDKGSELDELLAPFRADAEDKAEALRLYLLGRDLSALPERAAPSPVQYSGEYVTQQQVLLGRRGFYKAALLMLDYLLRLPPGQHVTVCAHQIDGLWHGNLPFALQFLQKIAVAVKRGATFTLVNRKAPGLHGSPFFSVFWLSVHLKGVIRSRYYTGEPPRELFVAAIPGYWSARMLADDTAEDSMICTLYTDPRSVREDAAHCAMHLQRSAPASQYGFLRRPLGDERNRQRWQPGPLPAWNEPGALPPDGSLAAICRVPSLGLMTKAELAVVAGAENLPPMPDHLFRDDGAFLPLPHRLIFCREDIREGLLWERRQNEPLSSLLGRGAFVPNTVLAAQLRHIVAAMKANPDFEVALMPRSAFQKLEIELVYWRNSAGVCWLQNGGESLYDNDPVLADTFASAVDYTWERLRQGWKKRRFVLQTLRAWLEGQGLDKEEPESAIAKNWELLPRE